MIITARGFWGSEEEGKEEDGEEEDAEEEERKEEDGEEEVILMAFGPSRPRAWVVGQSPLGCFMMLVGKLSVASGWGGGV